jgi:hypothetical protein
LGELVVRLQNRWYKVKVQVTYLKEWGEHIPSELLVIQAMTLRILESKLDHAGWIVAGLFPAEEPQLTEEESQNAIPRLQLPSQNSKTGILQLLSKVTAPFNHVGPQLKRSLRKAKYAKYEKSLNSLVQSIKDWQGEFDPTWYIVLNLQQERLNGKKDNLKAIDSTRGPFQQSPNSGSTATLVGSQAAEATAAGNIASSNTTNAPSLRGPNTNSTHPGPPIEQTSFSVDPGVITSVRRHVLFSSILITSKKADNKPLLLDSMAFDAAADEDAITTDAQNLVQKLTHTDPLTFGLLQCCGLIETRSDTSSPNSSLSISFLFALPDNHHSPKSLRSTLVNQTKCTLNERYNLAKRLANAVSFVHTARFVHKNVRPETIILLADDESTLGLAFLVGFSMFRHATGVSLLQGDDSVEKNLCEWVIFLDVS